MSQEAQKAYAEELENFTDNFLMEWDLSLNEAVGCLVVISNRLINRVLDLEGDDDDDS